MIKGRKMYLLAFEMLFFLFEQIMDFGNNFFIHRKSLRNYRKILIKALDQAI